MNTALAKWPSITATCFWVRSPALRRARPIRASAPGIIRITFFRVRRLFRLVRGLGIGSTINGFDPENDGVAPYDAVWNIGIQRELPSNMFLTANYTGNRANHLPSQLNPINQIRLRNIWRIYGSNLGQPYATVGTGSRDSAALSDVPQRLPDGNSIAGSAAIPAILRYLQQLRHDRIVALSRDADSRSKNVTPTDLSFLVSYNLVEDDVEHQFRIHFVCRAGARQEQSEIRMVNRQ